MANQYDTNLKLQAIADAIGDSSSSGLISALEDIADAVAGGGGGGSSAAGLVSDNFSETDTYDLGDYCIHNNTLYVCINAITTPGPWDLSDWQATNAGIQLSSLNSAITTINNKIDHGSVSATLSNNTYATAITAIRNAGYDATKLTINSKLIFHYNNSMSTIYTINNIENQWFSSVTATGSGTSCIILRMAESKAFQALGTTYTEISNETLTNINKIEIVY